MSVELSYNEDFFRFWRGRFVCNEAHAMSQRYVHFDVDELARLAADAVGSKACVGIEKYPDGMYNKAFLLRMEDGKQVVAKIPNPNAGGPHVVTASEVATMDFVSFDNVLCNVTGFDTLQLQTILGTPVPKVYAWSSRARENAVGAEYILMEKVPGIPRDKVWAGMEIGDRLTIVKAIARYQQTWMSVSFHQFGSFYYTQDLDMLAKQSPLFVDKDGTEITDQRFAVGPSTGREFFDDGRTALEFDRGPCELCAPENYSRNNY